MNRPQIDLNGTNDPGAILDELHGLVRAINNAAISRNQAEVAGPTAEVKYGRSDYGRSSDIEFKVETGQVIDAYDRKIESMIDGALYLIDEKLVAAIDGVRSRILDARKTSHSTSDIIADMIAARVGLR